MPRPQMPKGRITLSINTVLDGLPYWPAEIEIPIATMVAWAAIHGDEHIWDALAQSPARSKEQACLQSRAAIWWGITEALRYVQETVPDFNFFIESLGTAYEIPAEEVPHDRLERGDV